MNPVAAFAVGIAADHIPALIAALLLPMFVNAARRLRSPAGLGQTGWRRVAGGPPATTVQRWAAWLLGIAAIVHLALPLGHHDEPLLTIGFLASGAVYAWLAVRAVEGRTWRLWSALLLVGTLVAYLIVVGSGQEEPDQVGIVTALVELVAFGLCLVPDPRPGRRRWFARVAGSTGTVLTTFGVGAIIWIGTFLAHNASNTDAPSVAGGPAVAVAQPATHDHGGHDHARAARAQAGVVMRPAAESVATPPQQLAAERLAAVTRAALQRYANLDAALAAGYQLPMVSEGAAVHLENKAYKSDGRVLDPDRPETLVYAISGGRATLLGALFVMERAGVPGPEPGGPITRWHAHNICLTLLPPGFGIVSPFGSCPALSIAVTTPEMMHVWIVDNPGGAFADGLDDTWVRAYHAKHGLPYPPR